MQLPDERLVAETLSGSQAAYERLVARHERLVFRIAWSYTRERDGALDITQEVFVAVYEHLGSYRGEGAFRAWLSQIAHRRSANWCRDDRRRPDPAGLEWIAEPSCPPVQEADVLADETRRALLDRLDRLNPRQRIALTMRYFEGAPIPEIAETLACSEGVARNLLFRGLEQLRARLAPARNDS